MLNDLDFDKQHLWHPYSSMTQPLPMYKVASANGVRIELEDGRQLIDGMASWWSAIHGYNHPELNAAAKQQIDKMSHIMFGGLTHQPAIDLGRKLIELTPNGLEHIFYADSGSVAVEVAIKMAIQYWHSQGQPEKTKLISLRNAYHGDTFAAMSVTDPVNGMHHLFKNIIPQHYFVSAPSCGFAATAKKNELDELEAILQSHHTHIAAFILEPIVQGAGGMRFYSADYLRHAKRLCEQYNVLLIADEIATGFARTGKMFACDHAQITPDILCLGKAITGGYMSFAATLCTQQIAKGISDGEAGVFMHGPTFMANPLACALANKSIELLSASDWQSNIARISQQLKQHLEAASSTGGVSDIRVLGAIGVIEMQQTVNMPVLQAALVDHGVWVRPFGKLVYVMPPYIISNKDLAFLCHAMIQALKSIEKMQQPAQANLS